MAKGANIFADAAGILATAESTKATSVASATVGGEVTSAPSYLTVATNSCSFALGRLANNYPKVTEALLLSSFVKSSVRLLLELLGSFLEVDFGALVAPVEAGGAKGVGCVSEQVGLVAAALHGGGGGCLVC